MARHNVLGNSFLGIGLDEENESKLKVILKDKDMKGKEFLRYLVKKYIRESKK